MSAVSERPVQSLHERIARGHRAIAEARAQGRDTSAWEQHLAALEAEAARADGLDAAALCDHLERLHRLIGEGCRAGLHRHLARVPAEIVRSIITAAGPDVDADTTAQTCRRAGEAATLAALVDEYRFQLHLLKELDADSAFKWAAALEMCLSEPLGTRP